MSESMIAKLINGEINTAATIPKRTRTQIEAEKAKAIEEAALEASEELAEDLAENIAELAEDLTSQEAQEASDEQETAAE